jgi:hypothetical protein
VMMVLHVLEAWDLRRKQVISILEMMMVDVGREKDKADLSLTMVLLALEAMLKVILLVAW